MEIPHLKNDKLERKIFVTAEAVRISSQQRQQQQDERKTFSSSLTAYKNINYTIFARI